MLYYTEKEMASCWWNFVTSSTGSFQNDNPRYSSKLHFYFNVIHAPFLSVCLFSHQMLYSIPHYDKYIYIFMITCIAIKHKTGKIQYQLALVNFDVISLLHFAVYILATIYVSFSVILSEMNTGLILGLHPVNERRRYKVTPSLIGWAQT